MGNGSLAPSGSIQQTTCEHYWIIDAANGPTSIGTCRKCGEQREFSNSIEAPESWLLPSRAYMILNDADLALLDQEDHPVNED